MGFFFLLLNSNILGHVSVPLKSVSDDEDIHKKVLNSFKIFTFYRKVARISILCFLEDLRNKIFLSLSSKNVINLPKKKKMLHASRNFPVRLCHTHLQFSHRHLLLDIWLITQRLSNTNDTLFFYHSFIVINRVKMMRKLFLYSNVVTKRYQLSMHKCLLNKSKNNGIFV